MWWWWLRRRHGFQRYRWIAATARLRHIAGNATCRSAFSSTAGYIAGCCHRRRRIRQIPGIRSSRRIHPRRRIRPRPQRAPNAASRYNLADAKDFEVLSPGVSWWYDWSATPASGTAATLRAQYGMDFIPTLWNGNFNDAQIEQLLLSDPKIRFLLVLNEPNLTDQANMSPQAAAALWPRFETLAKNTGVKIVGPQITWGTMPGYQDPVAWLDAFYAAFRAANGRDPTIDYLGFHWYDYGLGAQLDRLTRYGKPFWVTEFANWHNGDGVAQIDTAAKQMAQMTDMVATCEARPDVFRYAWFTGRLGSQVTSDVHHTALLGQAGALTDVGRHYVSLPF